MQQQSCVWLAASATSSPVPFFYCSLSSPSWVLGCPILGSLGPVFIGPQLKHISTLLARDSYKHWTQTWGTQTWGPQDPWNWGPGTLGLRVLRVRLHCSSYSKYTGNLWLCYERRLRDMSCTSSLCIRKALFTAETILNYPLFLKVVYCQWLPVHRGIVRREKSPQSMHSLIQW